MRGTRRVEEVNDDSETAGDLEADQIPRFSCTWSLVFAGFFCLAADCGVMQVCVSWYTASSDWLSDAVRQNWSIIPGPIPLTLGERFMN